MNTAVERFFKCNGLMGVAQTINHVMKVTIWGELIISREIILETNQSRARRICDTEIRQYLNEKLVSQN